MSCLVMKFGGTSVANIDRIRNVARHVKREVDAGHDVAVVVSAMAGKTNELVEWCRDASPMHDAREYDAVVASGELVTAGLLALVLKDMGLKARSWAGWQIPLVTDGVHEQAVQEVVVRAVGHDSFLAALDREARYSPPGRMVEVEGVAVRNAAAVKHRSARAAQRDRRGWSARRSGDEVAVVISRRKPDGLARPRLGQRAGQFAGRSDQHAP